MTVTWTPMAILPNVRLSEPLGDELGVLAPVDDERVKSLCAQHPQLASFLNRFYDAFGVLLQPSVLLFNLDDRRLADVNAVASFRDLISLAVIAYGRTCEICFRNGGRPTYSNAFWIYPWNLSKDYDGLIGNTPAMLGWHTVSKFRGQSSPEMFVANVRSIDVDEPILGALLSRWSRRYLNDNPAWEDRALFRSLNMANQAMMIPSGADTTIYDVGRLIGLWVSAFEILIRPESEQVNTTKVDSHLDGISWRYQISAEAKHVVYPYKSNSVQRTLSSLIYGKMVELRNDFLHGNPIQSADLRLPGDAHITWAAASLYRLAMGQFLRMKPLAVTVSATEPSAFAEAASAWSSFYRYHDRAEEALIRACTADFSTTIGKILFKRPVIEEQTTK